jgi:DNA-binding NarL/FixJ family response regulator
MAQQSKIKSTKDKEMEQSKEDTKLKNNKKQIEWRRNKVRQLLLRGNTQSEISRSLDISQPTISRDIDYIHSKYITNSKNTIK